MTTPSRRLALPLLLAVLGAVAVALGELGLLVAGVLLFCPGWGLLRVLSVADRNFGAYGSAVCLSMLLLGLAARVPHGSDPGVAIGAAVGLCAYGTWRMRRYDTWLAADPPSDPMPLWPARTPACLVMGGAAIAAVLWARPLGTATLDGTLLVSAAEAAGWAVGGEDPWIAGTPLPDATLFQSAAGGLARASRLHPLVCVVLISLVSLSAVLAFVAEGISRLWGNRGGTRAMLAFLIGMHPLGTFFMLGSRDVEGARAAVALDFDPGITVALQPFVDGSPLALTLALVAMMQSCTLSILRRSSTHIPRLLAASTFGLVLAAPEAAMLLVPGWVLGIGFSHIACLGSIDNDPQVNASVRRRGEPRALRSPFWRPVLHMFVGLGLAALIVPVPDLPPQADVRPVAWSLLAALGPTCLLFMPGIRHLNASPGREAYHFVGLVTTTVVLLLTFDLFGDDGDVGVRLLSLLLAVPCANGAMKMIEIHGLRARLYLALLVVALLPSTIVVLWAAQRAPRVASVRPEPGARLQLRDDADTGVDGLLIAAIHDVAVDPDTVVALAEPPSDAARTALWSLGLHRPLLAAREGAPEAARRRLLVERLRRGDATAAWSLQETPELTGRPLLAVDGDLWPGFEPVVHAHGGRVVQRARRHHVVLVTADRLRADELSLEGLPSFGPELDEAMVFEQALSPCPAPNVALAAALSLPSDAHVPEALAARGVRVGAWTDDDATLGAAVGPWFGDAWHARPGATAVDLAETALAWIAEAPAEPAFAWIHVADASTPEARDLLDRALYRLTADLGTEARLIVTAPRGRPDLDVETRIPHELTEHGLRVPLVIVGGGAPATRTTRLVSFTDVGTLLTTGEFPERDEIELHWDDAQSGQRYVGRRTRHVKTIDVDASDEHPAGTWTIDLTTPHGETTPTWTEAEVDEVSSASVR